MGEGFEAMAKFPRPDLDKSNTSPLKPPFRLKCLVGLCINGPVHMISPRVNVEIAYPPNEQGFNIAIAKREFSTRAAP